MPSVTQPIFIQKGPALECHFQSETVHLEPWGEGIRVRATMNASLHDDLPQALLQMGSAPSRITLEDTRATLEVGDVRAEVLVFRRFDDGEIHLRFLNARTDEELLAEKRPHIVFPPPRYWRPAAGELWQLEAHFKAYDDERIYGLGQHQHGRLDQKGCVIELEQRNTEVVVPFMVSSRGYGFLWNNPGLGRVELGMNGTRWIAQGTPQMDYWVTAGSNPAQILERYTAVTGRAPMLPEWATGYWQCKLRYQTQSEVLEVAREFRARDLPLSVIVIDFFHWTMMGEWRFDPNAWPDPAGMVRELEGMGVKVMVSVWPTINPDSRDYRHMLEQGWLVRTDRGLGVQMGLVDANRTGRTDLVYYDATHPQARAFVWDRIHDGYFQHGIKNYWVDACEPEIYPTHPENLRYHAGPGVAVSSIYPLMQAQGIAEGLQFQGETPVLLCRSAWAGSQRFGAAVWSGDIDSSFAALRAQIPAGLNIAMSGIPWWTTDIGGFMGGDITDPDFRELLVRWFQYAVFCPITRMHGYRQPATATWGAGAANEPWSFGDAVYTILQDQLALRERLRPYVLEQMQVAHQTGTPPMRPLYFDFPDDPATHDQTLEFMLGPEILVAPITELGARSRGVYLPRGTRWVDAWMGESFGGGQTYTAQAPIERIPVFLREGTALSLAP
jgi:alpha-D-xyloside xylohydrolase